MKLNQNLRLEKMLNFFWFAFVLLLGCLVVNPSLGFTIVPTRTAKSTTTTTTTTTPSSRSFHQDWQQPFNGRLSSSSSSLFVALTDIDVSNRTEISYPDNTSKDEGEDAFSELDPSTLYDLSLWVKGQHTYLIATPAAKAATTTASSPSSSKGNVGSTEFYFHMNKGTKELHHYTPMNDKEEEMEYMEQLKRDNPIRVVFQHFTKNIILDNDINNDDGTPRNYLPLGTFSIHQIQRSYQQSPKHYSAGYDLVLDNCANLTVNMLSRLGIFGKEEDQQEEDNKSTTSASALPAAERLRLRQQIIDYTTDKLLQNRLTVRILRKNPNLRTILSTSNDNNNTSTNNKGSNEKQRQQQNQKEGEDFLSQYTDRELLECLVRTFIERLE